MSFEASKIKKSMTGGVSMIESVYSSEPHGSTPPILAKIPKNVRQIGQVNDIKKIYVEDYVISFIKRLGMQKDSSSELVVLLGQFVKINNCQCTFINGAIEIKNAIFEDNLVFSNEIWTEVYDTIKQYFTNVEIVGWSIIRAGLPLNVDERVRKVHVDNFAGQDKTLLLYDSLEREEVFYVFEENKLKRQDGYYIFYDKNPEMQNYIIARKGENKQERTAPVTKYASVTSKSETPKPPITIKKKPAIMYGLGAVAAVVVLVFSAAALNNYDNKMKGLENSLNVLSENVQVENGEGNKAAEPDVSEQASLPVETAQGKLSTINNEEDNQEIAEKTETAEPEATEEKEEEEDKETDKETVDKEETPKSPSAKQEKESKQTSTTENYYVVKKGDTLTSIAVKLYNSKSYVKEIKKLNDIEDTNKIKTGQKLLLP